MAFIILPVASLTVLSDMGMAITRPESTFRKTSLALTAIYIFILLLIHFSVIQFFILS